MSSPESNAVLTEGRSSPTRSGGPNPDTAPGADPVSRPGPVARLGRLFRMARHVPLRQLAARVRLTARRMRRARRPGRFRRRLRRTPLPALRLAPALPMRRGPCPKGLISRPAGGEEAFTFRFLNEARTYRLPVDWHDEALARGTRLWKLNLHYMEYLAELDDEGLRALVEDWMSANPPYGPEYWKDAWNSYALSIRVVVWMQELARRPDLSPALRRRMLASIVRQVRFLTGNLEVDVGGNHLVKNARALLWAGRFFAVREAHHWQALGTAVLQRELDVQVLADGMHYERSPAYHAQVFADLLDCLQVAPPGPLHAELRQALARMAPALVDLTHPDGRVSLFNDGAIDAGPPGALLDRWQRVSGRQVHPRATFGLPEAGYYGVRDGGAYVAVDCGPIGADALPAHAHGDVFSFEWSVDGRRVVVDPGVYEYNAGARRAAARSTRAHNTLALDGRDQAEFWGAFRVGRRPAVERLGYRALRGPGAGFRLAGRHDGYRVLAGRPMHERSFDVRPHRIAIRDSVRGGDGQRAEAGLLLHPACTVRLRPGGASITRGRIRARLRTRLPVRVETAAWCPRFGVARETTRIVLTLGRAPCAGRFVLERT